MTIYDIRFTRMILSLRGRGVAVAWDSLRMIVNGYRRNTEALQSDKSKRAFWGVQGLADDVLCRQQKLWTCDWP